MENYTMQYRAYIVFVTQREYIVEFREYFLFCNKIFAVFATK